MKTVLIMGINGGFGGYVAQALARQGWKIKAIMRDESKLPQHFMGAEVVQGDAANIDDVRQAAENVDLVVYGINPANYDWENKALPWLEVTAKVVEEKDLNIIFPGNVYVLNPQHGPSFDENTQLAPVSAKGEIRKAMEERLKIASKRGARVIIIRCGDFIGKNAKSTWIEQLIKSDQKKVKLLAPGPAELIHSYAYLPDVAKTAAAIVLKIDELPAFNVFHFKGHQFNFNDLADTIETITGKKVIMKKIPWFAVRIFSLFSKLFSGLLEMRYLWNVKLNLDDNKLERLLGHECAVTPLNEVLIESGLIKENVQLESIKI